MVSKEIAQQTAKILLDTQSILINVKEPFTYTSGKIGPIYVDIRRLISFPVERTILMNYAADITKPYNFDYVAGGETAGIPYAAFLAERLNLPMVYIRKKPKGHGRMAQIEGYIEKDNLSALLVEDLLTVGSSQKIFVKALRDASINVSHSFVIFSYDIYQQGKDNLKEMAIDCISLTNWWSVLDLLKQGNHFDSDTVISLESFLNDPESWAEDFIQRAS